MTSPSPTHTAALNDYYEVVEGWLSNAGPVGPLTDAADVAVSDGPDGELVYVLLRHPGRLLVMTPAGELVANFGEGILSDRPHGVEVAPDGTIYCVDERRHAIALFCLDGGFQRWIGTVDLPSATGVDSSLATLEGRLRSIQRTAGPFNLPTHVASGPNDRIWVTDGYGNAAVHIMTPTGTLQNTWGTPGEGPGQFRVPHYAVLLSGDRLAVCDRENGRVQIFDLDGRHLETWPGQRCAGIAYHPGEGLVYIAEMGVSAGECIFARGVVKDVEAPMIRVLTDKGDEVGAIVSRTDDPTDAGSFILPHGIAVSASGDIYLAETTTTYRGLRERYDGTGNQTWSGVPLDRGPLPAAFHSLQKFQRRRDRSLPGPY